MEQQIEIENKRLILLAYEDCYIEYDPDLNIFLMYKQEDDPEELPLILESEEFVYFENNELANIGNTNLTYEKFNEFKEMIFKELYNEENNNDK